MTLADLGEAFRQARLQSGQTQQEVARASGVPRSRISQFESGQLTELGTVKLLNLFSAVGLELVVRPWGHRRTLDDVIQEAAASLEAPTLRRRVRHPKTKEEAPSGNTDAPKHVSPFGEKENEMTASSPGQVAQAGSRGRE
jgi:transcriptional regulator with XRE-family HTH domain